MNHRLKITTRSRLYFKYKFFNFKFESTVCSPKNIPYKRFFDSFNHFISDKKESVIIERFGHEHLLDMTIRQIRDFKI